MINLAIGALGGWQIIAMAGAGGCGAAARALIEGLVARSKLTGFPLGTTIVNLSGSLLMGVAAGLTLELSQSALLHVVMVGVLGGYTTFSTAAVQAAEMIMAGRWPRAVCYVSGLLVGSVALAAAGIWAVGALVG